MCRIMEELAAEEREATQVKDLKNLMETLKLTIEQAMDALKIPADQREKFAEKL